MKLNEFKTLDEKCIQIVESLKTKLSGHGYHIVAYNTPEVIIKDGDELQLFGIVLLNEEEEKRVLYFREGFDYPLDTADKYADSIVHKIFELVSEKMGKEMKYIYHIDGEILSEDDLKEEKERELELADSFILEAANEIGFKLMKNTLLALKNGMFYLNEESMEVNGVPIFFNSYKQISLFDFDDYYA